MSDYFSLVSVVNTATDTGPSTSRKPDICLETNVCVKVGLAALGFCSSTAESVEESRVGSSAKVWWGRGTTLGGGGAKQLPDMPLPASATGPCELSAPPLPHSKTGLRP